MPLPPGMPIPEREARAPSKRKNPWEREPRFILDEFGIFQVPSFDMAANYKLV